MRSPVCTNCTILNPFYLTTYLSKSKITTFCRTKNKHYYIYFGSVHFLLYKPNPPHPHTLTHSHTHTHRFSRRTWACPYSPPGSAPGVLGGLAGPGWSPPSLPSAGGGGGSQGSEIPRVNISFADSWTRINNDGWRCTATTTRGLELPKHYCALFQSCDKKSCHNM